MIQFSHENLVVSTTLYYTIENGMRIYSDTRPKNNSYICIKTKIYPPNILMPHFWKRYNLSKHNILHMLNKCDKSFNSVIWQLALATLLQDEDVDKKPSIRSTYKGLFILLFSMNKYYLTKYIEKFQNYTSSCVNPDVLCVKRIDHNPLLPYIFVDNTTFEEVKKIVPETQPSLQWQVYYPFGYTHQDVLLVPIEYDSENDMILMNRVINRKVYDTIPIQRKKCILNVPFTVQIKQDIFVLIEESVFMKTTKKRKIKNHIYND